MDIVRAAALLEACAFDPDGAARAFDSVSDALNLRFFHLTNLSGPTPEHLAGTRSAAAVDEYLREGVFERDVWTQAALQTELPPSRLFTDRDLVTEDARGGAYYREYCPRHDVAYHGGWISKADTGGEIYFAIFRSAAQGDFTAAERREFAKLIPSANRAFNLMTKVREHRSIGVAQGLEAAGRPGLLIDSRGAVSHVTPGAQALLDESFGIRKGMLFAADGESNRRLGLVAAVARGEADMALLPNLIVRRAERKPIVLALSPIRGIGLDALPGARLVITLTDLDRDARFNAELAQSLFGMTVAEIEVATLLLNGRSAESVAAARGVRPSSVRQMIKTMLAKSGTHRQAELVALLAKLAAG